MAFISTTRRATESAPIGNAPKKPVQTVPSVPAPPIVPTTSATLGFLPSVPSNGGIVPTTSETLGIPPSAPAPAPTTRATNIRNQINKTAQDVKNEHDLSYIPPNVPLDKQWSERDSRAQYLSDSQHRWLDFHVNPNTQSWDLFALMVNSLAPSHQAAWFQTFLDSTKKDAKPTAKFKGLFLEGLVKDEIRKGSSLIDSVVSDPGFQAFAENTTALAEIIGGAILTITGVAAPIGGTLLGKGVKDAIGGAAQADQQAQQQAQQEATQKKAEDDAIKKAKEDETKAAQALADSRWHRFVIWVNSHLYIISPNSGK